MRPGSIMTITSIGYGDIAATALNELELTFGAILMLAAGIMWADFIAGFVTFLTTVNIESTEFRQTLKALNEFMSRTRLPDEMRLRVREYFHQTQHLREAAKRSALLETMSPALQTEVSWMVNQKWLNGIWFLAEAPQAFMVQLSTQISAQVFAPSETCPTGKLYIVHRGIALYGGRVLTAGRVWGEDAVILQSDLLLSPYIARAMNYLEVYSVDAESFESITNLFPSFAKKIRDRAIRLATRRGFVVAAGEVEKWRAGGLESTMAHLNMADPNFSLIGDILKAHEGLNEQLSLAVPKSKPESGEPPSKPGGERSSTTNGSSAAAQLGDRGARVDPSSISMLAQEVTRQLAATVTAEVARDVTAMLADQLAACVRHEVARGLEQMAGQQAQDRDGHAARARSGGEDELAPHRRPPIRTGGGATPMTPAPNSMLAETRDQASPKSMAALYTHSRIFRREMSRGSCSEITGANPGNDPASSSPGLGLRPESHVIARQAANGQWTHLTNSELRRLSTDGS